MVAIGSVVHERVEELDDLGMLASKLSVDHAHFVLVALVVELQ